MATLNIAGRKVTVDEGFLKLSPTEQNATVEEIAKTLGPASAAPSPAEVAPVQQPTAIPPPASTDSKGTLQTIREAINAPTRMLENGVLLGLGDRARAGMDALIGLSPSSYGENLKKEQGETEQFQKDHPIAAPVLEGVGGVISPLGVLGATAKGASLGVKTLIGAGTGAGIGGLQGGLGSKDWTNLPQVAADTAMGAGGGAVVGGLLPGTSRILGSGFQKAADFVRGRADGMSRATTRPLIQAIEADTTAAVQAQLDRLGPDAMLSDAGPALLGKAQGASLNSDEGRSVLQRALTTRNEGTNARIADDVTRALGPAEDPATVTAAIRQHRSDTDTVNYARAVGTGAPPVDTDGLLVELGQMIGQSPTGSMEHKALTNLRNMMMTERRVPRPDPITGAQMSDRNGNPLYDSHPVPQRDPAILHKIKGELDNVIEYDQPGLGIPAAALSRQQGALKHFRGMLNGEIEGQVPGYLEANRASASLAHRGDAVEAATQYLGNGKTVPSPERFSDEFAARPLGEKIAFAKGSRGNIDRILGTKANDLQALRGELQGEGGWNTAKIATVHGQPAADDLVASVDRNLKFRDTHNKVVENSQTEIRRAARLAMKPDTSTDTPFINPNSTISGMVATAGKKTVMAALNALSKSDPTRSFGDIARVLSAQGPERDRHFQAIVDALNKRQQHTEFGRQTGNIGAVVAAILEKGALDSALHKRDR